MKNVIITDKNGNFVKEEEFDLALQQKLIRRIVRVFVFNGKGELFVQKRGPRVKIWPSRGDSSAAGHVDPGETPEEAAKRELQEEIGLSVRELTKTADYYEEEKENGVIALRSFTTLYTLFCTKRTSASREQMGEIKIDGKEVSGGRWVKLEELEQEMKHEPKRFSPGFISAVERYREIN